MIKYKNVHVNKQITVTTCNIVNVGWIRNMYLHENHRFVKMHFADDYIYQRKFAVILLYITYFFIDFN